MNKYLEIGSPATQWCRIQAQIMVLHRKLKDADALATKKRRKKIPKCPSCGSNCYVVLYRVSFAPDHEGWDCECICDEKFSAQFVETRGPEDEKVTEIVDQIIDLKDRLKKLQPILSIS